MRPSSVRRSALLALVMAACIKPPLIPVTSSGVSYPVRSGPLGGGATGVFETSPDLGLAGVVLVVNAGSADEAPEKAGLAHLVEHLVMEDRRSGGSVEDRLESLGAGSYNAMTSWNETTYFAVLPDGNLPAALALFGEVLSDPLAGVDDATFEHERAIVRNEMRWRVENGTPGQALGLLARQVWPAGHPYAHQVAGDEESLTGLTLADARAFVREHYRLSSAVLATSSPRSLDDQWARAAEIPVWKRSVEAPSAASAGEGVVGGHVVTGHPPGPLVTRELPVATPQLWVGWAIPGETSAESDSAQLVAWVADRVFWSHVDDHDPDIAYVDAGVEEGRDASLFYLHATLKDGSHPESTAGSLVRTALRGVSEDVYSDFFGSFQAALATSQVGKEESFLQRLDDLARSSAISGAPTFLRSRPDRTMALTSSQVADFYHRYLTPELAHPLFVRPLGAAPSSGIAATDRGGAVIRDRPLEATDSATEEDAKGWMKPVGLARATRARLPNGMDVIFFPRQGSPFHSAVVAYHGGRGDERAPGAAVASRWAKAYVHFPAASWQVEYYDSVSADLTDATLRSPGSDLERTFVRLDAENEFQVFWPPQQFSRRVEAFEREEADPANVIARRLRAALFGSHPYGHSTTIAELRALSPRDVRAFMDQTFRPRNGVAIVVGDIAPAAAIEQVSRHLGRSGEASGSPADTLPAPPALEQAASGPGHRLVVQDRRGATDANLSFQCLLPPSTPETWADAWLFASAVGTRFRDELRERIASSYSAQSRIALYRGGTTVLTVSGDVDFARLPLALQVVRRFVEQDPARSIDANRFRRARMGAARSYDLSFETTEDVADEIAMLWNLGWPLDTVDHLPDAFLQAKREDLLPFAARCKDNWVLGILGDEALIRAALQGWAP